MGTVPSEISNFGMIWKPILPFTPVSATNPRVLWPTVVQDAYIQVAKSLPQSEQDLFLSDWIGSSRFVSSPGPIFTDTLNFYHAIVPGLMNVRRRSELLAQGWNPLGLHLHLNQTNAGEFLCTGAQILDIAGGDLLLQLALKFGLPPLAGILLALASQLLTGQIVKSACPGGNGETSLTGTPDPWGYYGRS